MKIVKISKPRVTTFLSLLFSVGFLLMPSRSGAVACSADVFNTGTGLVVAGPFSTIQAAVDNNNATPGRVIRVTGTCNERVTIPATRPRITLDGQGGANGVGGAEIVGTDSTHHTVAILGASTITIRGFASIRGGGGGISVKSGASVTIVNNTIESTGGDGVFVGERSSARVGFVNGNDTVASPNTIRSNLTGSGIVVTQRSEAWIVGNTIQDNGLDGVQVTTVSQANIAANLIDHNSRDGVSVSINSSVGLGDTTEGENLFNQANDTTAGMLNINFGVRCSVNSTVSSSKLGTLNGNSGRMQLDGSCPSTADLSDTGFAGGTTSGSIADTGGWAVTVLELSGPTRIQVSVSGAGTAPATFDMCPAVGTERVFLDQSGETADINCVDTVSGPSAGSHVFAVSASPQIEIRKPAADAAGVVVSMLPGNGVTIGSPVVPDSGNPQPIGVELVDASDVPFAVLGLQKDQSVDVEPNESTGKSDVTVVSSGSTGSIAVELVDTNDATIASLALGANVAVAMQPGASDTSNVTVLSGTVPMQLAGQTATAMLDAGDSVNVQSGTATSGVSNLQVVGGSVTVVVDGQPVIVNPGETFNEPAKAWIGLKNSDDVGIRFDLRAELYKDATLVGSGQANSIAGGSSGFNNAKLDTIPLNLSAPVDFPPGSTSTLSIKLYVRNACTGSGKNSGTARLWYNDAAANSQFGATIGTVSDFYLRDGFVLANGPGAGPKKTIDVAAGAKCSAFKPFGTWSISITP